MQVLKSQPTGGHLASVFSPPPQAYSLGASRLKDAKVRPEHALISKIQAICPDGLSPDVAGVLTALRKELVSQGDFRAASTIDFACTAVDGACPIESPSHEIEGARAHAGLVIWPHNLSAPHGRAG